MSSIIAKNLSKTYKIYNKHSDRAWETFFPFMGKKHAEFFALNGINMRIEKGETVGIIGKNGSGKSTLLKILAGVINQSGGSLSVNGKVSALLELGAGFNPEYTGVENIFFSSAVMGYSRAETQAKLNDILEFADIGGFADQPVKTYSSGMFVRLAFAVAINVQPDILIVDEALAVGDYKFQAKCYKKFDQLKKQGKTILLVTHDVDAVRKFCSRAIWMNGGEILLDGETLNVTSKYMEFMTQENPSIERILSGTRTDGDDKSVKIENRNTEGTAFEPINRFGSHVGSIYFVDLLGKNGDTSEEASSSNEFTEKQRVFEIGERIRLCVRFNIPEEVKLEDAAVAFAVKNKAGLDIMVFSTFEFEKAITKCGIGYAVFDFVNYLTEGEYFVVAALENRGSTPISYYDYIEGAAYFKVTASEVYYGAFRPYCNVEIG